jgi:hypothetical protein
LHGNLSTPFIGKKKYYLSNNCFPGTSLPESSNSEGENYLRQQIGFSKRGIQNIFPFSFAENMVSRGLGLPFCIRW